MNLPQSIQVLIEWAGHHAFLFGCIGSGSLLIYIGAIFLIPYLLRRVDPDYFIHMQEVTNGIRPPTHHHFLRHVLQNILGGFVIFAGIIMCFIPGQGILTIFLGLLLASYPGKHRLILAIIRQPPVSKGLNWMRRRHGAEDLKIPETSDSQHRRPD